MHRAPMIIVAIALVLACAAATQAEVRRGDAGTNTFAGTPQRDRYWGYGGDDFLSGRAAADHLYGGRGADTLYAGRGADNVHGGRGNDRVRAGRGRDDFWGGRGADYIRAGYGADRLNGGPGNDTILATADDGVVDSVDCGSGRDDHARIRAGDNAVNCETVETLP